MQSAWLRFGAALLVAVVATFAVFWLMQGLISAGLSVQGDQGVGKVIEFVDVSRDDSLQTRERKPRKPPAPQKEPPKPQMAKPAKTAKQAGDALGSGTADFAGEMDLSVDAGLAAGASADGDYLPIVKVTPQYPRRAAQRGIEGYVVLEFTVTEIGTVENPRIIESDPPEVFDKAAIDAALKFKYKPKIVNGKAERVAGVKNIIRFELDKSGGN